jgi:uncharacterized protein (DUF488 family)
MLLYTIGFTRKSAKEFFAILQKNDIRRVIDIRLNPHGQLAGFSKQADLVYFLKTINACDYAHLPDLAPTREILDSYRKNHDWDEYTRRFEQLMDQRAVPESLDRQVFENGPVCLLCSEETPDRCHRRLVAERLARAWENVEIRHLI